MALLKSESPQQNSCQGCKAPPRNRSRAHLYLVVANPASSLKDIEVRDVPTATTRVCHKQEVRVWAFVLVLGLATLMAGYILWAKASGLLY
jgi:hypothetical protein